MMRLSILTATVFWCLVVAPSAQAEPKSPFLSDQSPFLLQETGGVRVLRGLDSTVNFEPAKLAEEVVTEDLVETAIQKKDEEPIGRRQTTGIVTHVVGTFVNQNIFRYTNKSYNSDRIRVSRIGRPDNRNIVVHRVGQFAQGKIKILRSGVSSSHKIKVHRIGSV